jgi:hypothetical protein
MGSIYKKHAAGPLESVESYVACVQLSIFKDERRVPEEEASAVM